MISEFDWCGCKAITDEQKREIESSIHQTFEAQGDVILKPCHDGQVKVRINIADPLHLDLVGYVTCNCGKKYCKFTGNSNASTVTYERID